MIDRPLLVTDRPRLDPLSDVIALLRPRPVCSKPISAKGSWGVRYPPVSSPSFSIVLAGHCWLIIEGRPPTHLARGDFVLLPVTPSFELLSEPGMPCIVGRSSEEAQRHGEMEGPPDFEMLTGTFEIEPANTALFLSLLRQVIQIRSSDGDTERLAHIIHLIIDECAADRPGGPMIVQRLLEVLLMEALRWRNIERDVPPAGLLTGLSDQAISIALRVMHEDVKHGWTVNELAQRTGMSRSAFAKHFVETVGSSPMEYLYSWRMSLAQEALIRGKARLEVIAEAIGYQSASAFSTAFRRRVGCAPGMYSQWLRSERQPDI